MLTRGNSTVIIRNVPALICDDCGEYYLDEHTAEDVYAGTCASPRAARSVKYAVAGTEDRIRRDDYCLTKSASASVNFILTEASA